MSLPPQDVIEAFMKHCDCCQCCQNPPCDGVMAGGMCDEQRCAHDDADGDDWNEVDQEDRHDDGT
jgi:hypothetical protein